MSFPVLAGAISTMIFTLSMLPMLAKAARTKDLSSYSPGNMVLSNVGNVIHSIYVFHLPMGPAWVLHSFYLVSTALMLVWYLRYSTPRGRGRRRLRCGDEARAGGAGEDTFAVRAPRPGERGSPLRGRMRAMAPLDGRASALPLPVVDRSHGRSQGLPMAPLQP